MVKKKKEEFLLPGDILHGLLGNDLEAKAEDFMRAVTAEGELSLNAKVHDKLYHFLRFVPDKSNIGVEIVVEEEKKHNSFVTCYPFFRGIKNKVSIVDIKADSDRLAGFVKISMNEASPMWMFNPFYAHSITEMKKLVAKGKAELSISGLALQLEKTPKTVFKIDKGGMYEVALKEFLEKHPDKTKKDFPYVEVDASHASGLMPSDCLDGYEFSSDIYKVEKFRFMDMDFYCLEIEVLRDGDIGMKLNLYANSEMLNGYKPKVGDNVHGYMQLNAY